MTPAFISLPIDGSPVLVLLLFVSLGIALLCFGGDWLTRGAAGISVRLRVSPVVVGLTVVAIGTSMPELLTSLFAARSSPGLAVGNIVGSNIANIGLILGIAAMITPISVHLQLIRREVPVLVAVTALFIAFGVHARGLGRWEGVVLLALFVVYIAFHLHRAMREPADGSPEFAEEAGAAGASPVPRLIGLVAVGSIALAAGADVLVDSSVELAGRLGVSDVLIGVSIVAIGTSLPELAAAMASAARGHSELVAGNVVGSNLFNLVLIGGSVSLLVPIPVSASLFRVEFPAMAGLTVLLFFLFKSGRVVSRKEGVFLLALYIVIIGLSAGSQTGLF